MFNGEKRGGIFDSLSQALASRSETSPANRPNRVIVFGSNLSGGHELARDFRDYLKLRDVPDPVVQYVTEVGNIERRFLGRDTVQEGRTSPNLPRGVILLPVMRSHDPWGNGMDIDVYRDGIIRDRVDALSRKYNVPLVEIHERGPLEKAAGAAWKLLTGRK